MASKYRARYHDYTAGKDGKPESATVEIRVADLNAGNLAGEQAKHATFLTAMQALSLGLLAHETVILTDTFSNAGFATDTAAQRENKWLVTMEDNVTHRIESFTIPCADHSLLSSNHSELLDLANDPGLAFKNATQAIYRTISGNAATMVSVKWVGRNL